MRAGGGCGGGDCGVIRWRGANEMSFQTREWLFLIEDWSISLAGLFGFLSLIGLGVHAAACVAWRWIR
jgi:hypothetical protein